MSYGMGTLLGTQPYTHRERERKQPQEGLSGLHGKPLLREPPVLLSLGKVSLQVWQL